VSATFEPASAVGAGPAPDANAAGAALEWTFNPWRQSLPQAAFGALAVVVAMTGVARLGLPPLATVALAIAFLGTVQPALLPARCRVDEEGVARRIGVRWDRRPWSTIRVARFGRRGLFVSPLAHSTLLASFRGLWLPVPPAAKAALEDELRRRLAQHGL
jgi:hypothetical protein